MKRILTISAALFAGVLIFLAAGVADRTQALEIGDKAPDFKLKSVDGNYYSFETIKDANGEDPKGYILTFTCNTCPYAIAYEDRIIELHEKFASMGYPVVAIQPNDPAAQPGDSFVKMEERAREKGFKFVYLFDEGQQVYPQYGATRTPEIFLLDSDLTVRYHGAIDDNFQDSEAVKTNYVSNAIEALESGNDPDPATTKAIGCSIKTVKK